MLSTPADKKSNVHKIDTLPSPTGLILVVFATRDFVLGYTLPSLRDWFAICLALTCFPRMPSTPADQENSIWTRLTLCRPLRDWFAICLALTCFLRMLSTPADQENSIGTRLRSGHPALGYGI